MTASRRFALTGATSGVGLRLAEVATGAGHRLVALVRDPEKAEAKKLAALGVDLVRGDLDDATALGAVARGADALLHMAAHVGDWGPMEQFVRVNVVGTRNVLEAAAAADVKRFVHLSSTAVYGRPDRGVVDETWPTKHAGVPYDDTKVDSERAAFAFGRARGLEVAAVRPPIIYGPYDRNFMPRAARALQKRRFLLIDGGRAPLNVVWVDHVVDVMIRAAIHADAPGHAFNVMDEVDARPPSVAEVATTIADAIGAPKPDRSVPYAVALPLGHAALRAFQMAKAKEPPPLTPFVVKVLTRDVVYDASKAVRLLGWRPRVRAIEGIRREAEDYRARVLG
jgi:nucleoside-diphosphate-sugar epimerase